MTDHPFRVFDGGSDTNSDVPESVDFTANAMEGPMHVAEVIISPLDGDPNVRVNLSLFPPEPLTSISDHTRRATYCLLIEEEGAGTSRIDFEEEPDFSQIIATIVTSVADANISITLSSGASLGGTPLEDQVESGSLLTTEFDE